MENQEGTSKMTTTYRRPKVFVPMRENHNYGPAEEYGEIIAITPANVPDTYRASELLSMISEKMKDATPNDMILISGLTLSNCIAASIMAHRFGTVNFLLFQRGEYIMRRIILPTAIDKHDEILDTIDPPEDDGAEAG